MTDLTKTNQQSVADDYGIFRIFGNNWLITLCNVCALYSLHYLEMIEFSAGRNSMANTTISLRTDTELKAQAEEILNQLGMTLNGTFNMLLHQIVREKSVPLSLSLSSENSLYADLLVAEDERINGYVGRSGDEILKDFDLIVAEAEAKYGV
jgi:DNA-damage-inducible protein J